MENGARAGIVELLGHVPLFSELSPDELERVAQVAIPRSYPSDTRVFHEGDPGDAGCDLEQHLVDHHRESR